MKKFNRKRAVLAVLLTLCMIVTLLPAVVFAASGIRAADAAGDANGRAVITNGDANGGATGRAAVEVPRGTVGKADTVVTSGESDKPDDASDNKASDQARESAVQGVTDILGKSNVEVKTTIRDNYTDCDVTDAINITEGKDYIIDFTKDDNLSLALRSMVDLDKTKYYKFTNSDNNSLIETENPEEALLKIVGHKDENKAVMTLVQSIDQDMSYQLNFRRTQYTGSKLTYTDSKQDRETGKLIIYEIRDDYYTRYHFNCKLNLIAAAEVVPGQGNTDQGEINPSKDHSAAGQNAAKTQKRDSAAKTGDEASPLLWAGVLLLAAAGGATAVLYRRKTKN